jgi:hypothetical protein
MPSSQVGQAISQIKHIDQGPLFIIMGLFKDAETGRSLMLSPDFLDVSKRQGRSSRCSLEVSEAGQTSRTTRRSLSVASPMRQTARNDPTL